MNYLLSKKNRSFLLETECHIWCVDINNTYYINSLKDVSALSSKEKEKLYSFRFQEDKSRYLVSHIFLRKIINYYTDIPISLIKFRYNEYGKAYIYKDISFPFFFNLSHAHNKALIAINNTEVGVDVEYIKNLLDIYELASVIFSEREYECFLDLSCHNDKLNYFYTIWTKKEAFLKALSIGLVNDLKSINVCGQSQSKINNNFVIQKIDIKHDDYIANVAFEGCSAYK
ncbi:MAG: 4'-phosphopantetheinyl transferase superfamily protein [Rickettsiales bacterium]|nr:MAG: 4'-phosphopantetheinyl transferase superfamily protein [Rickettsiales bacterium]